MKALFFTSVQETIKTINQNEKKGFVFFVPIQWIKELSLLVGDNVVLCSTSGEFTPNGYSENVITGFSYEIQLGSIVEIQNPPILSLRKLEENYNKVKTNPNAFMLLMCDGLSGTEESIMSTFFFMKKDFKIIGGSAGDSLKFEKTLIFIGNKEVASVAILFDMKTRTQLIKENLYQPFEEKLLITSADPINRIVKTINEKPAATEYARVLNIKESELSDYFINNPLGKIYKDDILIASPMKVNPDKSITFYCQVMPNTFVYMLKPGNVEETIESTMTRLEFNPSFMIAINCILRSLKFKSEGSWKTVDRALLSKCKNATGFISYGEQYFTHHVNQSMVILSIE